VVVLIWKPEVALEREVEGDLFLQDIGQGFGFRPGSFDGAIRCVQGRAKSSSQSTFSSTARCACVHVHSISVLQWLLNAETSHPTSSPPHRLTRFFTTLHSALRNPSRAVLQFYPTSDDQIQLITSIAQRAGFGGGVVVDYPNSKKARKVFLCLFVGDGGSAQVPEGLGGDGAAAAAMEEGEDGKVKAKFEKRKQRESRRERNGKQKTIKGGKDWILRKKDVRGAHNTFLPLTDHHSKS
jgi:18S rRNA (guanine1575-N7)-methyltransferase